MIVFLVSYVTVSAFVITFGLAASEDSENELTGMEAIAMIVRAVCWLPVVLAALVVVAVDAAAATRRR